MVRLERVGLRGREDEHYSLSVQVLSQEFIGTVLVTIQKRDGVG